MAIAQPRAIESAADRELAEQTVKRLINHLFEDLDICQDSALVSRREAHSRAKSHRRRRQSETVKYLVKDFLLRRRFLRLPIDGGAFQVLVVLLLVKSSLSLVRLLLIRTVS
jgi:hypothetical protein